jgi:hypothetical protein
MSALPACMPIARFGVAAIVLAAMLSGSATHGATAIQDPARSAGDAGPITITAMNPDNPQARYRVRSAQSGDVVEISIDGGSQWFSVLAPVPAHPATAATNLLERPISCIPANYQSVNALTAIGAGAGTLYIGTAGTPGDYLDRGCSSAQGGPYVSVNGAAAVRLGTRGLPFAQDPVGRTIPAYGIDTVTADPHSGTIYVHAADGTGPGSSPAGLYKTSDAGATWSEIDTGLRPSDWITNSAGETVPVFDAGSLSIDPSDPSHLTFTNDTGTYQSTNAGAFWTSPGEGVTPVPSSTPAAPPTPTAATASGVLPQARSASTIATLPPGWAWQQIAPASVAPPARQDAATAWDSADNLLLVFGGSNNSAQPLSDLWSYSPATNTWVQRASGPSARLGTSAVWDTLDNQLLVFGGQTGSGASTIYMGDLWAYHPSTDSWNVLSATGAPGAPSARSHAVAAFDGSHLWLFSGEVSENPMQGSDDVWSFTPSNGGSAGIWAQLQASNAACTVTCPQPRYSATGTWNSATGALVVFGGRDNAQTVLSDMWTFMPGLGWQAGNSVSNLQEPAGRAGAGMAFDATYSAIAVGPGLSLAGGDVDTVNAALASPTGWVQLPVAASPLPPARQLTNFVWNAVDGSFYLFGGRVAGVGAASDLWRLGPSAPVATPTVQPTAATIGSLDEGWAVDGSGNVILTPAQVAATDNTGARYVRVNFRIGSAADWSDSARLAAYDTVINNYQLAGIQVLGLITQEATHSTQTDWVANNHEVSGGNGDNSFISNTYVQGAVKPLLAHFADRVKLWELWNEPNAYQSCAGNVCSGGSFIYPSNFAALLDDAYVAVKDPAPAGLGLSDVTLISGGLFGHSIGGVLTPTNAGADYLKNVFTMGISTVGSWAAFAAAHGGRYPLDAIGQHLYIDQNLITTTTDVATYYGWMRAAVAPFETPPPTYLTEGAWSTANVPQDVQAENLDLLFGATRDVGYVPLLTWFELQDVPQNSLYFGLADVNLAPKPSYSHYQTQVALTSSSSTPTTTPTATPSSTPTATATLTPVLGMTAVLTVQAGWNLITLPLSPATPQDAMTVLTTLLAQTHGSYAELDSYANGQWRPSVYDDVAGGTAGGTDFTLQLGHGYALYSDSAGSISISGTAAAAQPVSLASGWNLVGFPDAASNPAHAYDILNSLLTLSGGSYAELDGYASGRWFPNAYDDHGSLGGTNFTVQAGQGYALYTDKSPTLSL